MSEESKSFQDALQQEFHRYDADTINHKKDWLDIGDEKPANPMSISQMGHNISTLGDHGFIKHQNQKGQYPSFRNSLSDKLDSLEHGDTPDKSNLDRKIDGWKEKLGLAY